MTQTKAHNTGNARLGLRYILGALFILAGANHFVSPDFYRPMMPPLFPESTHDPLIYISGIAEIVGGLALFWSMAKTWAKWYLISLLWAVFPANIYMAIEQISPPGMQATALELWLRLPMQFVMMAAVWWACGDVVAKGAQNQSEQRQ